MVWAIVTIPAGYWKLSNFYWNQHCKGSMHGLKSQITGNTTNDSSNVSFRLFSWHSYKNHWTGSIKFLISQVDLFLNLQTQKVNSQWQSITPSSVTIFKYYESRSQKTFLFLELFPAFSKYILTSLLKIYPSVQSLSHVRLFCNYMNCSTSGLPVHHQLPELTQAHVHWVSDAIQPSSPLSSPSPPAPNPSQHQSLFQWVNSSHEVAKVLEFQL